MERAIERRGLSGDVLVAFLLAMVLAIGWSLRDWHQLVALRLPDTDDVMRLQQIRDWLGGQRFGDLSQHRLGAQSALGPGLAMHWSRLDDLVPGAIIFALTPLAGAHTAELVAVLAWPTMLFAMALALIGRIARILGGEEIARTAIVVAAIAYPATTIFLPGRIDHHGLQIVLLLAVIHALLAKPTMGSGLVAGLATAASLVVGLETAPLLGMIGIMLGIGWLSARPGADDRMMGFGIGTAAGLLAASILFRTDQWMYPACDGFTAIAWRGEVTMAFAPMALALAARDVTRPAKRAVLGAIICGLIVAGTITIAPQCLSPYGGIDPLLRQMWLGQVGEARPLFSAPPAIAIGYAGVMIAGIPASLWHRIRTGDRRWSALMFVQIAALALTCYQLRGAYAGAILAAPSLAGVIALARQRGAGWMAGAWLASAGMVYPIAAAAIVPQHSGPAQAGGPASHGCTSPEALGHLATLPQGRLLAPLDLGAYAIAATRLGVLGAPYHRNNAGNLAVYHFFLGTPDQTAAIVRDWSVRYVALCDDSFAELPTEPRMATRLRAGLVPAWLRPVEAFEGMTLFTVVPEKLPSDTVEQARP